MNWDETRDFLTPCFPEPIRSELALLQPGELREIRVRADRPTIFITGARVAQLPWSPGQHQLEAMVEALSGHSLYARSDEIGQGYLTLRGGHRMGICGHVLHRKAGNIVPDISSVCIRIACEWPGCADALLPYAHRGSVLLIGPPGSGKTTLLRDLARQLSTGRNARQTAVIDERGELAACVGGVPQLDVGCACDVLEGLNKSEAVSWLVRSMSPQIILTDELAGADDAAALLKAQSSGCAVCASVHGRSISDVAANPSMASLMAHRLFNCYAVLNEDGGGRIASLYDRTGNPLTAA